MAATVVTNRIGTAQTYTSIDTWEAAKPANLVSSDQIWRGELLNQSFNTGVSGATIAGSTTDATHYCELTSASGASICDAVSAGGGLTFNASGSYARLTNTTSSVTVLTLTENYSRVSRLQLGTTGSSGIGIATTGTGCLLDRVVVSSTSGPAGDFATGAKILTSLFIVTTATNGINATGSVKFLHNTIYRSGTLGGTGIAFVTFTGIVRNCAIFNFSSDIFSPGSGTIQTNATDSSSPSTGFTGSLTFSNCFLSTSDFRLKPSSPLMSVGTFDSEGTFDFGGYARMSDSPSIGAWQRPFQYVRSTDGNDSDTGLTWSLAKDTITAAINAMDFNSPGIIYVSDAHAEDSGVADDGEYMTANEATSPVLIVCGDDVATPPTTLTTSATFTSSGANSAVALRGHFYAYGISFRAGAGSAYPIMYLFGSSGDNLVFDSCELRCENASGAASSRIFANTSGIYPLFRNCNFKFAHTDAKIVIPNLTVIEGGGFLSGTSTPAVGVFSPDAARYWTSITGFNFSNLGSAVNLMTSGGEISIGHVVLRDCKLPTSWTGLMFDALDGWYSDTRVELYNCDSGDTNYRVRVEDYVGALRDETTIVRTGGATDGITPYSWKITTKSTIFFPGNVFIAPEIGLKMDTPGVSKTVSVEVCHDSQGAGTGGKLTDAQAWLEVVYQGTSGYPGSSLITDMKDIMAAAADQASSSETWTTTGLSSPIKQTLAVTFTPQRKGWYRVLVHIGVASKTIYVCPEVEVA